MKMLSDRVKKCMAENGFSQADISRAVGIARSSVNAWLSGKTTKIEGANLLKAAEYFGVRPDWLATGKGNMRPGGDLSQAETYVASDDVTVIPHMNGRAKGGGGGLAPSHEYIIGSISVTNEWINRRLPSITTKRNLAVIEAYGRSMEPTLMSGDLFVVDTGVHDAKIDGIYILQRLNTPEPEIMVKRLQRTLDGGLIVRSDNRTEYDPETVSASEISERVRIIGRVVWVWAGREA